jgi:hypothetical protein
MGHRRPCPSAVAAARDVLDSRGGEAGREAVVRVRALAVLLSSAIALGCGGKSVVRLDDESASSSGGSASSSGGSASSSGGSASSSGGTASSRGGTASSRGGSASTPEPRIGMPCQSDYDCLRVDAGAGSVAVCSRARRCEIGTPEPEPSVGCYRNEPTPPLELNDSRVYQSPICSTGLCLLRSYTLDPSNTTCTSRCATDADCAAPYAWTSTCLPTEVYENGDTGVVVNVCMPPMPW